MKIGVRPKASGFSKKQNQSGAGFQPARLNRPKADSSKKPPRAAALGLLVGLWPMRGFPDRCGVSSLPGRLPQGLEEFWFNILVKRNA